MRASASSSCTRRCASEYSFACSIDCATCAAIASSRSTSSSEKVRDVRVRTLSAPSSVPSRIRIGTARIDSYSSSGRFGKFLKRGSRCACDSSITGARAAAADPVIPSPGRIRGRRDISSIVLPLIYAGVLGTLVFGIWLWHRLGFSIGTGWIWASVALWVATNALGGIGGRHQERSRELAERLAAEGDAPSAELRALLRDAKGTAISAAAGATTLAILVLMISKP